MTFHIITLFPESFDSYINTSIIGRAIRDKKITIKFYNPRDYTKDKHRRVDQKPYGGGPGMVLEAPSVLKAVESALKKITPSNSKLKAKSSKLIIWLSPSGKQFDNNTAQKYTKYSDVVIICGRYEGVDERVKKILKAKEVSMGPYVLTGGELPAMTIIDTVARRIPGVLGKIESIEENRISSSEVYTRPDVLEYKGKKYRVPKVLLSGHHQKIEDWKRGK
jgi:tRNA (guanine37-N1)-methyltransferase